jgi:citrate lyase beta subunit
MLSKCASADELRLFLSSLQRDNLTGVIPLIETIDGHRNRKDIFHFALQQGCECVAFGAGDMSYELGIRRDYNLVLLQRIIADLLIEAKRSRINIIDSPSRILPGAGDDGASRLLGECAWSRDNGFQGKLAVHPAQIAAIESTFSRPADDTLSERILQMFEGVGTTRAWRCPETGNYVGLPSMRAALRSRERHDGT